jgi:hypothetical protein
MESEHFLLTASADFTLMSSTAESCLKKEGFVFLQNKTKNLVEFEIEKPVYFRIVIQRRNTPDVGNFILPSIKPAKGSLLDVWFTGDQDDSHNQEAIACARQFLRSLVSSLPVAPWEGLKFRESGKTRKKWKDVLG